MEQPLRTRDRINLTYAAFDDAVERGDTDALRVMCEEASASPEYTDPTHPGHKVYANFVAFCEIHLEPVAESPTAEGEERNDG